MSKNEGRKRNSVRNIIFSVGTYMITMLFAFIERKFFVSSLSSFYLGIGGVMSNIVSILTITELGFGEAIMFSLYKPIRENNEIKIVALLNLYKKTYRIIVLSISIVAFGFAPFLTFFIKGADIKTSHIYIIYALYVLNTLVSYFGAYRRSIIIAYQKRYIISAIHCICRVCMYGIQILLLITTHNFYLYLLMSIVFTFAESIILYIISGKRYPITTREETYTLAEEDTKDIYKNISAMAMHKIGGTLVTGTDNLLISKMVGVIQVGMYSNYVLIKSTIYTVTHSLFSSLVASMGSLGNEKKEYSEKIFNIIFYASSWLFGWCSISLLCLYDDFIALWLGNYYILDRVTVLLIVTSFYLTCMREPVIMTRDAYGLFWVDRWKAVVEAIVNLVVSVIMASKIGLAGIILGTIISTLSTCFWIEPLVLYKYGFNKSCKQFFVKYTQYMVNTFVCFIATYIICSFINSCSYLAFSIKIVICVVIPNLIFAMLTCRTIEFRYFYNMIKNKIKK